MYSITFSDEVLEEISALDSPAERRKLLAAIQCLPVDPSNPGIGEAIDARGRANRISVISGISFLYWPDHALRKIRILAVQAVR